MKKSPVLLLLASLLVLVPFTVMAQQGRMRLGNLRIIPGLTLQGLYDDNIFLGNGTNTTTELEESDWITHLMPALGLNYTLPERGSLALGYEGDLAYYSDNEDNDWQTHKATFNLNYEAPGGLVVGVNNVYTDAEDPYGSLEQYRLGLKTERWNNDLKAKIGYDFGRRLRIIAFYDFYKQDYDLARDYTQDYDVNEYGVGLQMRLLPRTRAFVRYHYGEQDYFSHRLSENVTEATDADSVWHRLNAGLTWDTGAKLIGELNAGYQWRDFENAADSTGDPYEDKDTWIAATSVTFTATAGTTLGAHIMRAVRPTLAGTREFFEDTSVGLNLQQRLNAKITLRAGALYSDNEYNLPADNPREDDNYNADIGLDYQIQDWLKAGAGYSYRKKDSNYAEYDFTSNQFMISVRAVY